MKPQYLLLSPTNSAIPSETNPNQLNPSSEIDDKIPNESSQPNAQVGRQSEEMSSSSPDYFESCKDKCSYLKKENILDVYEDLHGFYLHFL